MPSNVGSSTYGVWALALVVIAVLLAKLTWPILIGIGAALYFGRILVNGFDGRN